MWAELAVQASVEARKVSREPGRQALFENLTDGDDSNEGEFEGQGNNQMLVGNTETGEIARFLTAPNGAEVTGLTWSPDKKVAFVGIQHPGGSWPDGNGKPRSSVIAVWREDGALIG